MKSLFYFSFAICLLTQLHAQNIAGTVPNPSIQILIDSTIDATQWHIPSIMDLDLDLDGINDLSFELTLGPVVIDGGNILRYKALNNNFQFMTQDEPLAFLWDKAVVYNLGDTITTDSINYWASDSLTEIGNWGCMFCPGPSNLQAVYLGYKKGNYEGWIEFSFNLADQDTISFTLHSFCVEEAPLSLNRPSLINLKAFPNPSNATFFLKGDLSKFTTMKLYSVKGELLWTRPIDDQIEIDAKGYFYLSLEGKNGLQKNLTLLKTD